MLLLQELNKTARLYAKIHAFLFQQPNETANDNDINRIRNSQNLSNNENNNTRVKSAAVVFIKEKSGRYQVMREPFMLEKCVVSQDPEYLDVFEILEWSKEAFLIKVDNHSLKSAAIAMINSI